MPVKPYTNSSECRCDLRAETAFQTPVDRSGELRRGADPFVLRPLCDRHDFQNLTVVGPQSIVSTNVLANSVGALVEDSPDSAQDSRPDAPRLSDMSPSLLHPTRTASCAAHASRQSSVPASNRERCGFVHVRDEFAVDIPAAGCADRSLGAADDVARTHQLSTPMEVTAARSINVEFVRVETRSSSTATCQRRLP
jgi:hypothetical protein